MDCRKIQRAFIGLADGDLRPVAEREVRQHLERCPRCAAEWDSVQDFIALGDEALAYTGPKLSFDALRPRMATIEPLDEVLRYQLPKLHIPGTTPRFATAMVLLALLAGVPYAVRHTRQVYVAVQCPFEQQKDTLKAAMEDGHFPGDPIPADKVAREEQQA